MAREETQATVERWRAFWKHQDCPLHREDSPAHYEAYGAELRMLLEGTGTSRVLEIGCGNGALYGPVGFDRAAVYRGVDLGEGMLEDFERRHPGTDTVLASGHSYRDERQYDVVFSNGVVQCFTPSMLDEHVANAVAMLAPGGRLVCASVPWRLLRWPYVRGKLGGASGKGLAGSMLAMWREIRHKPIGEWYDLDDFRSLGRRHGLSATFYGSLHYMYRFHAVFARDGAPVDGEPV